MATTPIEKISMFIYFESLFARVFVLYVLNTNAKFLSIRMLFIIQSTKLFFMHNFRLQKLEI